MIVVVGVLVFVVVTLAGSRHLYAHRSSVVAARGNTTTPAVDLLHFLFLPPLRLPLSVSEPRCLQQPLPSLPL